MNPDLVTSVGISVKGRWMVQTEDEAATFSPTSLSWVGLATALIARGWGPHFQNLQQRWEAREANGENAALRRWMDANRARGGDVAGSFWDDVWSVAADRAGQVAAAVAPAVKGASVGAMTLLAGAAIIYYAANKGDA